MIFFVKILKEFYSLIYEKQKKYGRNKTKLSSGPRFIEDKSWTFMKSTLRVDFREVLEINKKLTEGYKHNLNVIMELTQLLVEYRQFIDEISKNMADLDKQNLQSINALGNMNHLRYLTSDKLSDIASGFDSQLSQIKKVNLNSDMDTSMLKRTREQINRLVDPQTQQAIQNQIKRANQNKPSQSGGSKKETRAASRNIRGNERGRQSGRGRR